jgi:hypothetical protein
MSHLFIFKTSRKMQCRYIKPDGSSCWAIAMEGSEYCWFHAPEVDYERSEAQSKGGKAYKTGIYKQLPAVKLDKIEDVPQLLMDTVKQLRQGFIGPRIAATLGYLSGMILKSFELVHDDLRFIKIEKEISEMKGILNEKLNEKPKTQK